MKLVECVPNFSEGRDKGKVEAIVAAARSVEGVRVLDVETDPDHNRCVLTFVAPPDAAVEAAFRAAKKAAELIDLTRHRGEHPRMGATDVIPFIPVEGAGMEECVALARRLGERIGRELEVPVFLYAAAAARPERRDLARVRKGQFEALREAIGKDPARDPDFGPRRIHPTAGATAVGAREQIINFNLNTTLKDLEAGKAVAKTVRTSGGGLPELRAKEIGLSSGKVQISTVLTDYRRTSLAAVCSAVEREVLAKGGEVESTELIGLVPRAALVGFAVERLKAKGFDPRTQVLEERLDAASGDRAPAAAAPAAVSSWEEAAWKVAAALASTLPTPGGGSAAAITGAMGCALGRMAAGITLQSKKLDPALKPGLERLLGELRSAQARLESLWSDDARAFDAVMAALKLPKEDPARPKRLEAALLGAAEVPLATAKTAAEALAKLLSAAGIGPGVASDKACAAHLLKAAALCAAENVRINTASLKDRAAAVRLERELEGALRF